MKKGLFFIILSVFCITSSAMAQDTKPAENPSGTFESSYNSGIQLFQSKDYEKSRDAFAKALEKDPHNVSALTNLALVQFKLNQKGLSIGLLRQVLQLDPEQATAKAALKFALSQLEIKEIPHKIETYETLREDFLLPVSLNIYISLTALGLFAGGWLMLTFIGRRKRALQTEEAPPGFPVITSLLCLLFVASAVLTFFKVYDQNLTRGTIVADKVSVQAAPGENQVVLFDLYTGFEVIVQNTESEWLQVTYPGASTGWIKKDSLFITSIR